MAQSSQLIMLLDGNYHSALRIAEELKRCLDVAILGVAPEPTSCLLRSNYPSIRDIASETSMGNYTCRILDLIRKHNPDFILPVGARSVIALDSIRAKIPEGTFMLASSAALHTCLDKASVLRVARNIGIGTPVDYTDYIDSVDRTGQTERALGEIEFPVFIKASREGGPKVRARVDRRELFWQTYDRLRQEAMGGALLVQECVVGSPATFGYGLLLLNGLTVLAFGHEELRSVPRSGGSGTRLRVFTNDELRCASERLLLELGYEGVALVEYKRRCDGSFVLMEVNPKFWDSFSLASKCNYHFAAQLVATCLDIPVRTYEPIGRGEMVFPLREAWYCAKNWGKNGEFFLWSLAAMMYPPARWDMSIREMWWSRPPICHAARKALHRYTRK